MVIRKPPSPITSTVVSSGAPLATPSAVPKPRPIEAKSLVSLKWPGSGHGQIGHDAEEVAGVVDEVAVGRQQLLERHAERARIDRARRVGRREIARDVETRAGSASVSSERNGRSALEPRGSASSSACAASRASPTTATSAGCQRPIWPRSASTWISGTLGSEWPKLMVRRVEPGAEHQHAIGLVDHAAGGGMGERSDDAEIGGMAAEHVLAARRGDQQGARCDRPAAPVSALAPARWAPRPATIRGLRLCRSSAAAASIACARGAAGWPQGGASAGGVAPWQTPCRQAGR